jgi:hypothetical protein
MTTRVTARIPVTPDLHSEVNRAKDEAGAADFDALLREMLNEFDLETVEENG